MNTTIENPWSLSNSEADLMLSLSDLELQTWLMRFPKMTRARIWRRLKSRESKAKREASLDKYCPHKPFPKQQQFLDLTCREALFGGAAGPGKMLDIQTPIATPRGWSTMGDLKQGDVVFSDTGEECKVVAVHPVNLTPISYRLEFDDGETIDACEDHLWKTMTASDMAAMTRRNPEWRAKRRQGRASRVTGKRTEAQTAATIARNKVWRPPTLPPPEGSIKTTREIAETLLVRGRRNHCIPVCGALETPEAELLVDPYLLGAWLGDGKSVGGGVSTADEEIVQAFRDGGYEVSYSSKYDWNIRGLRPKLSAMSLKNNKHIPLTYLRASQRQRLALLQGLMDTDGTVAKGGGAEFCNTNHALAEGVRELACGLGWKPRVREGRAKLKGRDCGPKWTVAFTPDEHVFRLPRKREKQRLSSRRTGRFRYIVSCERIPPKAMRCITVDSPSGMYLAGRAMIPTHNTDALLMAAIEYVHEPQYSALILRRDFPRLSLPQSIMDRAKTWLSNTDATWNAQDKIFRFPSGATLQFGYIDNPDDRFRYASSEYAFVGFDELTEFRLGDDEHNPYLFMFSRNRREETNSVPLRIRAATNPGNIGHDFVKRRFITQEAEEALKRGESGVYYADEEQKDRAFVPALLSDNTAVRRDEYEAGLKHLPTVTRARLLQGDWSIKEASIIPVEHLRYYETQGDILIATDASGQDRGRIDSRQMQRFATIDTAGTSKEKAAEKKGKNPSWSVCMVWEWWSNSKFLFLRHVWRERVDWSGLKSGIQKTLDDWRCKRVIIENAHHGPPLSSELRGVTTSLVGPVLAGMKGGSAASGGAKLERAVASGLLTILEEGRIFLPKHNTTWLPKLEAELLGWTGLDEETADQIDCMSYAAHDAKKGGGSWGGVNP